MVIFICSPLNSAACRKITLGTLILLLWYHYMHNCGVTTTAACFSDGVRPLSSIMGVFFCCYCYYLGFLSLRLSHVNPLFVCLRVGMGARTCPGSPFAWRIKSVFHDSFIYFNFLVTMCPHKVLNKIKNEIQRRFIDVLGATLKYWTRPSKVMYFASKQVW